MIEKKIRFSINILPEELDLNADVDLLEQVILNLLINAIHATNNTSSASIQLNAFRDISGRINIQVKDNGHGISKEVQEKIFIPFFSTKQSGSGIGLSLSRQIIRAHGGVMKVTSNPNSDTIFTLQFR